jgi:CheY-like chemotaxis protein
MDVYVGEVKFSDTQDYVERAFRHVAEERGLKFEVQLDPDLPEALITDAKRLQQVLRNLLSNAFKFTEKGSVTLRVQKAVRGWSRQQLNSAESVIAFSVIDTGIGIPAQRQRIIFESFQQADGSTSRKYGGTGLGLSISRELANLLGGELNLVSAPGKGSIFTLHLPSRLSPNRAGLQRNTVTSPDSISSGTLTASQGEVILDNRESIEPGDRVLLIVEDDPHFARVLLEMANRRGFKAVVAQRGADAVVLANQLRPQAITLDIELPDIDGWTVLERLRQNLGTRNIPVHVISVSGDRIQSLKNGAIAFVQKPVSRDALKHVFASIETFLTRRVRRVLIVEDDEAQRKGIAELVSRPDVETTGVATAAEALEKLRELEFDCMVLDLGLPDMGGIDLVDQINRDVAPRLPIVVYTGRELTKKQETELRRVADSIIVKDANSLARLLDETSVFLHRDTGDVPPADGATPGRVSTDPVLSGRKVLVVDDDIRNIFALTSLLERQQMTVHYAENGRDALDVLKSTPDIEAVLLDVMMPDMDGFETMHAIRQIKQFESLPIIALTAKAMKGDRQKCIDAGASDYVTKPADTDQILSLLRVWLHR